MKEKTVLVVDDDFALRQMFVKLLTLEGFRTLIARDGAEALECARQQKPDLILLDYNLPRRNGLEVMADLERLHDDLKFMLVTGSDEENLEARARKAGALFFAKPFEVEAMLDAIRLSLS